EEDEVVEVAREDLVDRQELVEAEAREPRDRDDGGRRPGVDGRRRLVPGRGRERRQLPVEPGEGEAGLQVVTLDEEAEADGGAGDGHGDPAALAELLVEGDAEDREAQHEPRALDGELALP